MQEIVSKMLQDPGYLLFVLIGSKQISFTLTSSIVYTAKVVSLILCFLHMF